MGLEMKYFVLNPKSKTRYDMYSQASRVAMEAYARIIKSQDPELAEQLQEWVDREDVYRLGLPKGGDNE